MNLKPFVNKEVVLQFKPGCAWIACMADGGGRPVPMVGKDKDGSEAVVSMPFVQGKLLERDGAFVIKYNANAANMETTVAVETIFAVTVISEDKILSV